MSKNNFSLNIYTMALFRAYNIISPLGYGPINAPNPTIAIKKLVKPYPHGQFNNISFSDGNLTHNANIQYYMNGSQPKFRAMIAPYPIFPPPILPPTNSYPNITPIAETASAGAIANALTCTVKIDLNGDYTLENCVWKNDDFKIGMKWTVSGTSLGGNTPIDDLTIEMIKDVDNTAGGGVASATDYKVNGKRTIRSPTMRIATGIPMGIPMVQPLQQMYHHSGRSHMDYRIR